MHSIKFCAPCRYRIVVQGILSGMLYPYFEGMKIEEEMGKSEVKSTSITGNVKDQAALAGLLITLYDFHYPILLVECLE